MKSPSKRQLTIGAIGLLVFLLLGIAGAVGYKTYNIGKNTKKIDSINATVQNGSRDKDSCREIYNFDANLIPADNTVFKRNEFIQFKNECDVSFDIHAQDLEEDFCQEMIVGNKSDFVGRFLILDGFSEVRQQCSLKYLQTEFGTGVFFNPENDFRSQVTIDFGLPFFIDLDEANKQDFIENRTAAKKRLIELLSIEPDIALSVEDITLYPKQAILDLPLKPTKRYSFGLKDFDSGIEGELTKTEKFSFTTPENKFFGFRKLDKVSLFQDTNLPQLELLSYDSEKSGATAKLCRIDNETYVKIEAFSSETDMGELRDTFFTEGIDTLPTLDCITKKLDFSQESEGENLRKVAFDFHSELGQPARSGLYYMTFEDPADRVFNNKIQEAIFFGVVDSHVTMKLSKNGEAFFFVNDFSGKPLANQNIRVYPNTFKSKKTQWNRSKKDYDVTYFSAMNTEVFGTGVVLGKTNEEGVLQVNLKGKVDNAYEKTFKNWSYENDGNYNSFFVTSASETNLSYVSSKWNGGISGWNFGYDIGNSWWYGSTSENADAIEIDRWSQPNPEYFSHVFSDRRLYLPGETVEIKAIIRKSNDLSIDVGKELELIITDPSGDEVLRRDITTSEYGNIHTAYDIGTDAVLGSYRVEILSGDETIGSARFNVEIFKNPKFRSEIMLETTGLNGELVENIDVTTTKNRWGYEDTTYKGKFEIQATVSSKYYSGAPVANIEAEYKVYKQYYYDESYWNDCFYGCYWEPEKEFYTEGKMTLDENGFAKFTIPVAFESNYGDYKYIVEVSVEDSAGDLISNSNAIIARLPDEYKRWNPESGVVFNTEKRFYKAGESVTLNGTLQNGSFTSDYNDKYYLIIKKKEYQTKKVQDVRGYTRPVITSTEVMEQILKINDTNFKVTEDGKLELAYTLKDTGEYIFEFGKVNSELLFDREALLSDFRENGGETIYKTYSGELEANWQTLDILRKNCDPNVQKCVEKEIVKLFGCKEDYIDEDCRDTKKTLSFGMKFTPSDLLDSTTNKYFTLVAYGEKEAQNPVQSDNKITVLSEKVSYKLGEMARVLVRLPYANGKVLLTTEKQGVLDYEYIDVPGNTFFKEILVDDTFVPNAYIGVTIIDTNNEQIPEYKVGYTEIVVDKTDKKSEISIATDKRTYEPRETVTIDITSLDNSGQPKSSEVTLMVIDDSLISLMGNIDMNSLEKFYKKLPFQIQTSISNIAMLKNYYFSRQGIVGGSGFGNLKGGDSESSSRNIFKNTAYYNQSIITDTNGKASLSFTLPDNLTNFRIIAIANSKDNFFGYSGSFIEVRKDVVVEDRTPLILRDGDSITLGANIFNTTDETLDFRATLSIDGIEVTDPEQTLKLAAETSKFLEWNIQNTISCPELQQVCEIPYTISVIGDTEKHSDIIEGTIAIKSIPSLIQNTQVTQILSSGTANLDLKIPDNTNENRSIYEYSFSNNPLMGIEKIVKSLAVYPYGCAEQLLSSTLPNAIVKQFSTLLISTGLDETEIQKNIDDGLKKIYDLALDNGSFGYWEGDTTANVHITAYAVRVLLAIEKTGTTVDNDVLTGAAEYLEKAYPKLAGYEKTETLWALSQYYGEKTESIIDIADISFEQNDDYYSNSNHNLIAYTYGLVLANPEKFQSTIELNIDTIQKNIANGYTGRYYYNSLSDTAEFTQLLMDYNYDEDLISRYIKDLYDRDWSTYWYSTKTKNSAFMAFAKYIEKYGSNQLSEMSYTLNGETKTLSLGGPNPNIKQVTGGLASVVTDGTANLEITHVSGAPVYAQAMIQSHPLDPLKVKNFSEGVSLTRTIYEVTNPEQVSDECSWVNSETPSNGKYVCTLGKGLKLHTSNEFKKGAIYKIVLQPTFPNKQNRENLTIEDYIPAGFRVMNSNFQTNSIATSQESSQNSWTWSHTENRPELVMAHAKNTWGTIRPYEYFVMADFAGDFIYPPAVVYLMYQPDTRANTEFRRVVIK